MEKNSSEVRFSDVDIYYNYVFDLGHAVNPIDSARLVLQTEVAQAFRNYLTGNSEVADRYSQLIKSYYKSSNVRTEIDNWGGESKLVAVVQVVKTSSY